MVEAGVPKQEAAVGKKEEVRGVHGVDNGSMLMVCGAGEEGLLIGCCRWAGWAHGLGEEDQVGMVLWPSAMWCAREMALPVWKATAEGTGTGCKMSEVMGVGGAGWRIVSGNPIPAVDAYIWSRHGVRWSVKGGGQNMVARSGGQEVERGERRFNWPGTKTVGRGCHHPESPSPRLSDPGVRSKKPLGRPIWRPKFWGARPGWYKDTVQRPRRHQIGPHIGGGAAAVIGQLPRPVAKLGNFAGNYCVDNSGGLPNTHTCVGQPGGLQAPGASQHKANREKVGGFG